MLPRLALGARACLSSSRTLALSRSVTYFTKSHEYLNVAADGTALVGVTDHAQGQLGDVVFVGLPEVGATFKKGASFASVESVKAASDVYLPVGGTIVEVNKALVNDPGAVNKSAESSAWFAKIKVADAKEVQGLLDAAQYKAACDAEKH